MKTMLLVLFLFLGAGSWAYAETLIFSNSGLDADAYLDEILKQLPSLKGIQNPDGSFSNPLITLEHTPKEIRVTIPDKLDAASRATIQSLYSTKPKRSPVLNVKPGAQKKLKDLGFSDEEIDLILQ